MSIKAKNDNYYMYLLKIVDAEMINVDHSNFEDDHKVNEYLNLFKENLKEDNDRDRKLQNMLSAFLKGYDYEFSKSRKVVCGMDKEYQAMVNFLHPYLVRQKHSSTFSNTIRLGCAKNNQTFAVEVSFLIYDRICIKVPKKQAHLMKIKDKELYEILSDNLSQNSIMKHILKGM